jgi:preprotein translocase subunit SecG
MMLPLAAVPFIMKVTAFIWMTVTVCLILLILVQKGRGGGLSGAFGGAGGGASLLGTKTGDFLTWVTIGLVILFLVLAVVMVKWYRPTSSDDLAVPAAPISAPAVPALPAE